MTVNKNILGILSVLAIGLIAYLLAPFIPYLNTVILGLLLGIFLGNIIPFPTRFEPGIQLISGKGLELAILFLSFSINYRNLVGLGASSFILIAVVLFGTLFLTRVISRKMDCPGNSGLLIGFGTAVCGSSAIAALAPQLNSNKTETGLAMAVVNLLGTVMMLLFPLVLPFFSLSDMDQGLLIGGSLHAVGNVAGAGYTISPAVGEAAITIKLARIAMLSPALIFMQFLLRDKSKGLSKVKFKFPWYLTGFLIITILNSVFTLPAPFVSFMQEVGEILLMLAMVAIGLKIKILTLLKSGKKGVAFGVVIFSSLLLLLLIGLTIMHS